MNSAAGYLDALVALRAHVSATTLTTAPKPPKSTYGATSPTVIMVSPHPDDECIVGALPLRLRVESGWRVINVAVTHGSNAARQRARALELDAACDYLGFESLRFSDTGLAGIQLQERAAPSAQWTHAVASLARVMADHRPQLILTPHATDAQPTHMATHALTLDALASLPATFSTTLALTEYWSTLEAPNFMVEASETHLAQLVSGLLFHTGEIARNPYHLSLPHWMIDNVRRGSERVGGAGTSAAEFTFATLYELRRWVNGALQPRPERGVFASKNEDVGVLLTQMSETAPAKVAP